MDPHNMSSYVKHIHQSRWSRLARKNQHTHSYEFFFLPRTKRGRQQNETADRPRSVCLWPRGRETWPRLCKITHTGFATSAAQRERRTLTQCTSLKPRARGRKDQIKPWAAQLKRDSFYAVFFVSSPSRLLVSVSRRFARPEKAVLARNPTNQNSSPARGSVYCQRPAAERLHCGHRCCCFFSGLHRFILMIRRSPGLSIPGKKRRVTGNSRSVGERKRSGQCAEAA